MLNLEKRLQEFEGGKILDVATGRGEFIHFLVHTIKSFDEIVGIDITDMAFREIMGFFEDHAVKLHKMDAYKMDFRDETFDTVCLSNSIHHFNDVDKVFSEMKRILKPGGNFVIQEMVCDDSQTEQQKSHIMLHHWFAKIDMMNNRYHDHTCTKEQLWEQIDAIGLSEYEKFEYTPEMKEPMSEEGINRYIHLTDQVISNFRNSDNYCALNKEKEIIQEHIRKNGFAPADMIFLMGKK